MQDLGYGDNYKYSHDYPSNFVNQEFLPTDIINTKLYDPGSSLREKGLRDFLKVRWNDKYGY